MKILAFHAHAGDPLSFLIKAITRSQYCHGAVLVDNKKWIESILTETGQIPIENAHLIVEAYWPKVRSRFLDASELAEIDVFDVPAFTGEMEDRSMRWIGEQLNQGTSYDVVDLFRFVPGFRAQLGEANDDAYKRHTFCSMFVFNAYRFGGLRLLNCHDYECSPDKMGWSPLSVPAAKLT
jgi:hypothetical protein